MVELERKQQMKNMNPKLVNRKSVIFSQDNTRFHVSLVMKPKLFGWEFFTHFILSRNFLKETFQFPGGQQK